MGFEISNIGVVAAIAAGAVSFLSPVRDQHLWHRIEGVI